MAVSIINLNGKRKQIMAWQTMLRFYCEDCYCLVPAYGRLPCIGNAIPVHGSLSDVLKTWFYRYSSIIFSIIL